MERSTVSAASSLTKKNYAVGKIDTHCEISENIIIYLFLILNKKNTNLHSNENRTIVPHTRDTVATWSGNSGHQFKTKLCNSNIY